MICIIKLLLTDVMRNSKKTLHREQQRTTEFHREKRYMDINNTITDFK